MEAFVPLRERSLAELLRQAIVARAEGLVLLRNRQGARHGVWLRGGYAVGAHVAGRFDPLLALLRADGVLSARAQLACVAALADARVRSGRLATCIGGVAPERVRETLGAQLVARVGALLQVAASDGYDARLEPGLVPDGEQSVCMPLGSLLRRAGHADEVATASASAGAGRRDDVSAAAGSDTRDEARRRLRALAKQLHPDRHGDLDPAVQHELARQLAEATAAYHGFV